jgi:hypothetical protein
MLLPVALLAIGLYLLVGCVYIPTFGGLKSGRNYAKQVGDAKSKAAIRVGVSTRDDVLRAFGEPYAKKADGSGYAYIWTVQNGFAVWPLCFHVESVTGNRTLVLRFDATGRVASSEILKWNEPVILNLSSGYAPLPMDFRNQQQQHLRPSTLPAQ